MALKEQINVLLNTKMDRQAFIKQIAVGMLAVTGASSVFRVLAPKQEVVSGGYGVSAYGGGHELNKSN